jgi:hypothetical protein
MPKNLKPGKRQQRLSSLHWLPNSKRENKTVTDDERSRKTEIVNGTVTEIVMNDHATKKGVIGNVIEINETIRIASVEVMTKSVSIANGSSRNTRNSNATWSQCSARSKSLPMPVSETRLSDSNVS